MSDNENQSDLAAERAVIAGIFAYGSDSYLDIQDIVTPETFTLDSNKIVWSCIDYIFKQEPEAKIDYPSIMSAANTLGFTSILETNSERQHLRALMDMSIKQETVRRMAGRIRKLEIIRLLDAQLDVAKKDIRGLTGDEPLGEILSMAETPIFDFTNLLTDNQSRGVKLMGEGSTEYLEYLLSNPREIIGISTGMKRFDKALGGGLRVNCVDIVAARPKNGKSFLADNICISIADASHIPVFNVDTEMNWEEHLHRVIASMSGVDIEEIETGKFKLTKKQIFDASAKLKSIPYYYQSVIDFNFEEILASMRRWVTRTVGLDENGKAKPCVIVYDYLKMLSDDFTKQNMQEYQALGFITTALKNFMGRYSIPCLCFSQLNREGAEREDETVISGSDRVAHYCTSLSIFKKKTTDERVEAGPKGKIYTHKLIPIIGRHGAGLAEGDYINIETHYARGKIIEGPTRYELQNGPAKEKAFVVNHSDDDLDIDLR